MTTRIENSQMIKSCLMVAKCHTFRTSGGMDEMCWLGMLDMASAGNSAKSSALRPPDMETKNIRQFTYASMVPF